MKAVIIEGQEFKSEHNFWRHLPCMIFSNEVKIICADGSSKFDQALDSIYNDLVCDMQHGRKSDILVCLDTTADSLHYADDWGRVLAWKRQHRELKEYITIHKADNYCFEDCFLYFDFFLQWQYYDVCNIHYILGVNPKTIEAYKEYISVPDLYRTNKLRLYVNTHSESTLSLWIKEHFSGVEIDRIGFEVLASKLVSVLSRGDLNFHIDKGSFGSCWHDVCRRPSNSCKLYLLFYGLKQEKSTLIPVENKASQTRMRELFEQKKCGLWDGCKLSSDVVIAPPLEEKDKLFLLIKHSKILSHLISHNMWLMRQESAH